MPPTGLLKLLLWTKKYAEHETCRDTLAAETREKQDICMIRLKGCAVPLRLRLLGT